MPKSLYWHSITSVRNCICFLGTLANPNGLLEWVAGCWKKDAQQKEIGDHTSHREQDQLLRYWSKGYLLKRAFINRFCQKSSQEIPVLFWRKCPMSFQKRVAEAPHFSVHMGSDLWSSSGLLPAASPGQTEFSASEWGQCRFYGMAVSLKTWVLTFFPVLAWIH